MRFDTIIRNGTIVTASDTYAGDVGITNGLITAIGKDLPVENADKILDSKNCLVIPGGIDVHTHLDMPFGGTTSADDFETGTRAAAFGGTTTLIDFAIQYKGQSLRHAFDTWMKKAEGKAVADYAFHCIITELGGSQLEEMGALVREGVSSFKLFMAYPGVFMLDDATIFRAMLQAAKHGGMICMHAENGGAIDVLVQRALAEGKTAPKYHALTRPTTAKAKPLPVPLRSPRWRARPSTSCIFPATTRLKRCARRATADYPPMRKRARNIFTSLWIIWMSPALKARSMCSLLHSVKNGIRKNSGKDWRATRCKSSQPIIVRFASRSKRRWAETTSRRFQMAVPASNIVSA